MAQRAFHSDSHRPTSWAGNDGGKREDEGCGAWGSGAVGPVSDTVGNNISNNNMVFVCKRRDDAHG